MTTRRFVVTAAVAGMAAQTKAGVWIPLFDGVSLKGWKETEYPARGTVSVRDGIIILGTVKTTGITWTGDFPKAGYEIRFEAARLEGKDFFAGLTFPVNDSYCAWINGGWDGTVVGLSSLDGDDASENDTSTARDFVIGRWYAFRLEVTKDRIQGWIDEKVVIDADIKGRQVALRPGDNDLGIPLGFASYRTVGGLRKVEYRLL